VIQKGKEMVAPVDITANEMAAAIKFLWQVKDDMNVIFAEHEIERLEADDS